MEYMFRNAGKLDNDTRKLIKIITVECRVCNKMNGPDPDL